MGALNYRMYSVECRRTLYLAGYVANNTISLEAHRFHQQHSGQTLHQSIPEVASRIHLQYHPSHQKHWPSPSRIASVMRRIFEAENDMGRILKLHIYIPGIACGEGIVEIHWRRKASQWFDDIQYLRNYAVPGAGGISDQAIGQLDGREYHLCWSSILSDGVTIRWKISCVPWKKQDVDKSIAPRTGSILNQGIQ